MVLCYSPDRLARNYAYQALLIEEFTRAGTEVVFVKGPRGDTPEDELLVQFQGMIAEYERAQIAERTRRGKTHRARAGAVNVLGGAPFGYRYLRKTDHADARYEIVAHEAAVVAEMFRRYAEGGVADRRAGPLAASTGRRHPHRQNPLGPLHHLGRCCATPPTPAGPLRQDRTRQPSSAGLNRIARLPGARRRGHSRPDRAREDWIEIPVPALVDEDTFAAGANAGWDNKRFAPATPRFRPCCRVWPPARAAATPTTAPRPRTKPATRSTTTAASASDDYRYEHGRVCDNKPVRADYLDDLVWDQMTALLADPALVRAELDRRLDRAARRRPGHRPAHPPATGAGQDHRARSPLSAPTRKS